jgi:hypothetical protein
MLNAQPGIENLLKKGSDRPRVFPCGLVSVRKVKSEQNVESQEIRVLYKPKEYLGLEKVFSLGVFPYAEINRNMVSLRALNLLRQLLLES